MDFLSDNGFTLIGIYQVFFVKIHIFYVLVCNQLDQLVPHIGPTLAHYMTCHSIGI